MDWTKTPESLVRFLDERMAGTKAKRRTMFGYPCYFLNNNMCAGTFEDGLFLRLCAKGRDEAMAEHKGLTVFEPRPGQVMGEYVVVPRSVREDSAKFDRLLRRTIAYVSSMPPKPKGKKPRA